MKRLAITVILTATAVAVAQNPGTPTNQQPATSNQPGHYVGVASCATSGCHGSTQPLNATRVLQNEYYTWLDRDRHAKTYNILFNAASARIAKNMRLKGKPYEENLCLDCHTTNLPAAVVTGTVDREDGVQCEVCHGPASGWRAQHAEEGWTHEQSVAAGMIDLRNINARGTVCAACHVGNAKKEVDHELIASGHPVLAFELDNYTASMPPHWTLGRDTHGVKAWAVGQVVKFRESLDNLARHARGDEWPEFSDMSCHNCHHDLKGSTWRQERGWSASTYDRAGLPSWSPQHWAMLRLLIGRVSTGSRDELDPLVRQIARGVSRMNDPSGVASNADRARRIADTLVPRLEAMQWSDADVRSLMTAIASDRDLILTSDVHTAEQAALALQSLSSSLTRRNPRLLRGNMTRSIDALFDELQNRDDYDPARFVTKLNAVRAAL
ncbi:MAG TPA: multiheme c-type cytochrome [Thermoanaerobaculia bacterium]|nr:multiheme c-type cytochrome [Thermoanaerobaculia bacterium]